MSSVPLRATVDPDRIAPEAGDPAVTSVMRDEVVFCLPSTPADAVAKLMADNVLSEIVVMLDRRPVGYITKEDVIDALVAGGVVLGGSDFAVRPPTTDVLARDVLRAAPLLVDERQRLSECVSLMVGQRRRLAIVMHEDETPVGMITPREVADVALATLATQAEQPLHA